MIDTVIKSIKECRPIFLNRNFSIKNKNSISDYVTSADLEIERILSKQLNQLFPTASILGEENLNTFPESDYIWVIDPIDGTSNFIHNLNYSCISVGLLYKNEPILGVIYNPYTDEVFSAQKGNGAYLNGERIVTSDNPFERSLFCTALSVYKKDLARNCLNIIESVYSQCEDIRRMGSAALELASLAAGSTELYFEIRVQPWDFAAAEILIKEAGGYVGTIEYNSTVFHRPIPLVCANNKENFDRLMSIVKKELPLIPYDD